MPRLRKRGISEVYAAIVIVLITIVAGVSLYAFVGPRLAGLTVSKVSASLPGVSVYLTPTHRIIVTGELKNEGSSPISVEEIIINKTGALITVTPEYPKTSVKPGEVINILGFTNATTVSSLKIGESVIVIVKYCGASGTCNYISTITTIRPVTG